MKQHLVLQTDTHNMNHDTAKILSFFCCLALLTACGPERPHHAGVTERFIRSSTPPPATGQNQPEAPADLEENIDEPEIPPSAEIPEDIIPEPETLGVCDQILNVAGQCPNYGYNCAAEPQAHSECFLDTLLVYQNPCMLFNEQPLCSNAQVSDYGVGSCMLQECFGMNTALACYENLEMLCEWT